ncbi:MAG TPA: TlpA disulfide reductase family protein [Candidatus Polarisedimenticolaceae bacterium]|nr:TlpA disulfide reductase family protein [Candidatus Polarisedimenticolaceae bacterium]
MPNRIVVAAVVAAALAARPAGAGPFRNRPTPPPPGIALAPGDTVIPLQARTLDGQGHTVEWASAKISLVNFWATWCTPCREEMPAIEQLRAARGKDGLQVVGVVIQDLAPADEVRRIAAESKVDYLLLRGGDEVTRIWRGIQIVPTTFLVDSKGKVVRKYIGTGKEEIAALTRDVDDFLAGRPLGPPYVPPPDAAMVPVTP